MLPDFFNRAISMKKFILLALAALWLAAPATAQAQSVTKLCFPATGLTATRTSCIPVDSSNPLPTTATLSAAGGVNVTVTNTTGTPAVVTCTNCGATSITTVTIQNVGQPANVSELNSAAILSAVQSAIPAGTNTIGTVTATNTNAAFTQSATPTVTTSNYAAGNCMGGFNQLTINNISGQTGFVTNFRVTSMAGNTGGINVWLFDSQPTTSTCTDKGTFTLSTADTDKLIAAPQNGTLAAVTGATTPTNISVDFTPPRPVNPSGARVIWYALQAATSLTPASTTDIHVRAGSALN